MNYSKICIYLLLLFMSCSQHKNENQIVNVSSGLVERFNDFQSNFVIARNVDVWLPQDYSNDKKYAVLYMHDGQMLFDSTTTWNNQEWGVDEVVSQLLEDNKIRQTIIVGIWNTAFRHSEYFPQKPFEKLPLELQDSLIHLSKRNQNTALFKTKVISDNYLKFIVEELKPFIDKKYSTHTDMKNTFVAGSSMGGLISMYAINEYPNIFGGAACLSTHWIGSFDTSNNPIPQTFVNYLEEHLPKPKNHKIYFDYGTETLDAKYEPYQKLVDSIMVKNGYDDKNWKTLKFEGADHSERSWNKRLNLPLFFLLKRNEE